MPVAARTTSSPPNRLSPFAILLVSGRLFAALSLSESPNNMMPHAPDEAHTRPLSAAGSMVPPAPACPALSKKASLVRPNQAAVREHFTTQEAASLV